MQIAQETVGERVLPHREIPDILAAMTMAVSDEGSGIGGVLEKMAEIQAALPSQDGVAWFNRLYAKTTEAIAQAIADGRFEAPELLEELDVAFAELYFAAYDGDRTGSEIPKAWSPLFDVRSSQTIAPIQFALAGMNAHINRDLPFAVATVAERHCFEPREDSAFYRDFLVVNEILKETEARVKVWFAEGFVGEVDRAFGEVDDRIALWSIVHARRTAWENAELLWGLRALPALREPFGSALDRLVGVAGRALLVAP